ncbi:MAG: 1-acyl-sn-glycerol-3-phosphate acyltransferase [Vicingaceae bacterium]
MLYRILQFIMKRSISAHYLELKGIGFNTISKKGPLLIAATHPNSFLDALLLTVLINRPLHFLARSDVFKSKWSNYILRRLNLIPIYRLQEGQENLNKNERTFEECNKILDAGGAILIFAEGLSVIDLKLRPLKKGLARIAFGFAEKHNFSTNCEIVPVAINYDRPTEFRSKILIGVGEMAKITDFEKAYRESPSAGYKALNKHVFKELKEHTIEVSEEDYLIYKAVTELDSCYQQNSLARKKLIADHIHEADKKNNEKFQELTEKTEEAFKILKKYRLNFRKLKANNGLSLKSGLLLLLGLPIGIIAFILNFMPFLIAKKITDKKVKAIEFYASVRYVLGTLLWIMWVTIITVIASFYSLIFLVSPVLLFVLLKYYLKYYEEYKYFRATYKLRLLKKNEVDYQNLQSLIVSIYRLRTSLGLSPKVGN